MPSTPPVCAAGRRCSRTAPPASCPTSAEPARSRSAINDDGTVVGNSDRPGGSAEQAYRTDGVTATALESLDPTAPSTANDVNDAGVVVGTTGQAAARWVGGELETLFDGAANAVADTGAVVGVSAEGTAVLWQDGELVDLNDLVDPSAGWILYEARDITPDGSVIVGVGERFGETRGFRLAIDGATGAKAPTPRRLRPRPRSLRRRPGPGGSTSR